jgi:hypothetical protein
MISRSFSLPEDTAILGHKSSDCLLGFLRHGDAPAIEANQTRDDGEQNKEFHTVKGTLNRLTLACLLHAITVGANFLEVKSMELGTMLSAAMLKADNDKRVCFVHEIRPGSKIYEVVSLPPQLGTYYKIEPNRIVTKVVARVVRDFFYEENGDENDNRQLVQRRIRNHSTFLSRQTYPA